MELQPLLTRQQLDQVFKDPRTLLAFENYLRQIAVVIPTDITGLQNLNFVLTQLDPTNAPNGHLITAGANITVTAAAGSVTIKAVPSGTNGQIQYNNAGVFGAFTTSGDATINTATGVLTLATVATAGTYGDSLTIPVLTLDAKGRTLSVTPTAIPLFTSTVKGLAPLSGGGTTNFLRADGTWAAPAGSGGTVSSVGLSLPATFTVSGSPVTGSGTLTAVYATQTANTIFAGPTTGAAAAPTFRAMVAADLPNTAVTAGAYTNANITVDAQGRITLAANGSAGSGTVTHTAGALTSGQLIVGNGTADIKTGDLSGDVSTSGSAVTTIGALKVATGMIQANAVTLAKLATQADKTILANIAGSTAVPTASGLSAILDNIFSSTQGSILVRDTSAWVAVGAGTSGFALVSNGAGATPSYQAVGAGAGGAMTLLATANPSGVTTVSFTSIAGTFKHLKIVGMGRSSLAGTGTDAVFMRFNGDSAANYWWQSVFGTGSTVGAGASTAAGQNTYIRGAELPTAGDAASQPTVFEATIPMYAGTTFDKSALYSYGVNNTSTVNNHVIQTGSGFWKSTAAITQIDLVITGNWVSGSEVSLYGLS